MVSGTDVVLYVQSVGGSGCLLNLRHWCLCVSRSDPRGELVPDVVSEFVV